MLDFRVLGPLDVVGAGGPLRLGGTKQRATLALLLLDANRLVSVDRLADALYADAAPVTAVTQVQKQISELRKALGSASTIETRSPGYVIRLVPEQLDLHRFERQAAEANRALVRGAAAVAADLLREALALWRGPPLADLTFEPFAQPGIARLEEIRLAAIEQRIDADLALGRHTELVGELEALTIDHPLRERFRSQLMLALYRSGRQAEALDVYRTARGVLVGELGIEPTPALRGLERAILSQDPALDLGRTAAALAVPSAEADRAVLALAADEEGLNDLLSVAEQLARPPGRELIIVRLLSEEGDVEDAAARLKARRASIAVTARAAAFTSTDPASEAGRLAAAYEVDLVLLAAPSDLDAARVPSDLAMVLERSPADVAFLVGSVDLEKRQGLYVPFGGGEHDWAALELAAWLAQATGVPLRLVGTKADPAHGRRDASRLLAHASLAVQQLVGVEAEPVLAEASDEGLSNAVEAAGMVVAGISEHWRRQGIGDSRRILLRAARAPLLLVHRGPRPGGLAPRESRTRFTWSMAT